MFGINSTDYDKFIYEEYLRDFLPDRMIDIHVHIWKEGMERDGSESRKGMVDWTKLVAPDCSIEDLMRSYEQMFPGKSVKPVLMGWPSCDLQKTNAYALSCAKEYKLPVFYCTNWDTDPEEIRRAITEEGYCGIKPYLNNSPPYIPAAEVRIFDFLTHEHLKVCDELGAVVMLHIPRSLRLRDPVNLAQMMEIEEKYPNARFFLFSNDPQWTGEHFGGKNRVLVEGTTEDTGYLDLYLMSRCRHNIIANSSFSWWGAWLNSNPSKTVAAPSRWLNGQDCRDIYTEDMIRI